MAKIEKADFGCHCAACGRAIEPHYIMPVVVHPGRVARGRRFLQNWCVECIAGAKPTDCRPAPTLGELAANGKLMKDWEKIATGVRK
jgi:hypothetical protein